MEFEQDAQREQEEERLFSAERLTFFSDAVVAIAMTLLALELPVPREGTNRAALHDILANRDAFLAFLISFLVIARSWSGHHHLFGFVRTLAPGVMRWNMWWLLMIVIIPFATKTLTENGAFETGFILYAVVQVLLASFFAMVVRSVQVGGVLRASTPPDLIPTTYRRLVTFGLAFFVSIPIALFTHWAFACWAAIPLLGQLITRIRRFRAS